MGMREYEFIVYNVRDGIVVLKALSKRVKKVRVKRIVIEFEGDPSIVGGIKSGLRHKLRDYDSLRLATFS